MQLRRVLCRNGCQLLKHIRLPVADAVDGCFGWELFLTPGFRCLPEGLAEEPDCVCGISESGLCECLFDRDSIVRQEAFHMLELAVRNALGDAL